MQYNSNMIRSNSADGGFSELLDRVTRCRRLFILTGAGCSTESGIPDYRDECGAWKRRRPMLISEFLRTPEARRRYWSRSFVGWPMVSAAQPNSTHRSLARLESLIGVSRLVTQNVDGLHAKAGSQLVIDLHGRLDSVQCLTCRYEVDRTVFQMQLADLNPDQPGEEYGSAPDGDADIDSGPIWDFVVPDCPVCGGILKPAVVFFGEGVPRVRVDEAFQAINESNGVLVVGSSLAVWSGYRFARRAVELGVPLLIVNRGHTRADAEATLKVSAECGETLQRLVDTLARGCDSAFVERERGQNIQ